MRQPFEVRGMIERTINLGGAEVGERGGAIF